MWKKRDEGGMFSESVGNRRTHSTRCMLQLAVISRWHATWHGGLHSWLLQPERRTQCKDMRVGCFQRQQFICRFSANVPRWLQKVDSYTRWLRLQAS